MQLKTLPCTCFTLLFLFFILSSASYANSDSDGRNLNGLVLPTLDMSTLWLFSQTVSGTDSNGKKDSKSLENAWGLNVDLDFPFYPNFHAGFYFQGYRGFIKGNPLIQYNLLYNAVGIGIFLKPQIEIPFPYGNLALSLRIPLGYEIPIGIPLIGAPNFRPDFDGNIKGAPPQYGFKTGITLGLEYFPVYILGFFIEAGYQIAYHNFALSQLSLIDYRYQKISEIGYLIHGGILAAGIKIAY